MSSKHLLVLIAAWLVVSTSAQNVLAQPTEALVVAAGGDVGVGIESPQDPLHILRTDPSKTSLRVENSNPQTQNTEVALENSAGTWVLRNNRGGSLVLNLRGDSGFEFHLDGDGNLTIQGNLVTGGSGVCDPGPCDRTFSDYELESIQEHASYMWENGHLWGVGPTPEGAPLNLSKRTGGMLHELEKAHIYIEQLHKRLEDGSKEREALAERLDALEASIGEPR